MKRIGLCLIFAAAFAVLAGGCQTWRQEDAPAFGLGMKAVWIPAGSFLMGSPQYEIDRWENEGLQRLVTISEGFWMGAHPVTQQQWTQVMGENPVPGIAALYAPNRPVVMVSWYDALVFANRLSLIEGLVPAYSINGSSNPDDWGPVPANRDAAWDAVQTVPGSTGWRLPTEAQWEYAARAGTVSAFSSGTADWENEAELDGIGWFNFNSGGILHAVGLKKPNPWGLYDMHGNVWEWVWDWLGEYPRRPQTDPQGPAYGYRRVFRGGCWLGFARGARSAARNFESPILRTDVLGLRLIRP